MAGTIDITKNTDEDTYFFYCDSLRMDYCRNLGIEGWVFAQNPAGNLDCTCQGGTTGKNVLNEDCSCDNNQPTEYGLGGKLCDFYTKTKINKIFYSQIPRYAIHGFCRRSEQPCPVRMRFCQ